MLQFLVNNTFIGCKYFCFLFIRSAWAIAVSWLVYACATGNAGPINTLLSWTPFGPVSRINYSAYLYHILLFTIFLQNMKGTMVFNDYLIATLYCGLLTLSYGVAFLAALWFESPFIALEKLIFWNLIFGSRKYFHDMHVSDSSFIKFLLPFKSDFPQKNAWLRL